MSVGRFYDKHYRKFLIIPFFLLFLAVIQISFMVATTGDFVHKGVSLKGGISVRVQTAADNAAVVEEKLQLHFPQADIQVRKITQSGITEAFVVESTSNIQLKELIVEIKEIMGDDAPSLEDLAAETSEISSQFSSTFFIATMKALLFAFLFMAAMVFYYFRKPIPSLAVILAAFSDIIVTIAVLNIFGIRLTTGGIAALLMLIGYSVDTDILLSSRVLKRSEGTVPERIAGAFRTGIIMSLSTLSAVFIGYLFATSDTLKQIMLILFIGLLIDLIMTWFQNAGLLRWSIEGKKHGTA